MNINKNIVALSLLLSLATPALAMRLSVSVPKEAKAGDTVLVSVKTAPSAKCKIEAQDAGLTQSLNLLDQTANIKGKASWQFDIPKGFNADKMPVIVTVEKNGKQDKAVGAILIRK